MKAKIKLICMSFDGEFVINSEHDNLDEAIETAQDLGSKWFFYPFCVFVKGQTVKDCGGVFFNMQTHEPILSELFKGKRFVTMQKVFETASKVKDLQGADCEVFESYIIDHIKNKL